MALQVWLPLNGDLKNKGVADVNVTNSGATVDSNGKIGQCYKFGTSASYVDIPKEAMNGFSTEASVCFWLKINTFNTAWATYFQAGLTSTAWTHYIFGFLRNNSTSNCCFAISDTSTSSQTSYRTPNLSTGVWYHFAITYKPGHCCIYVNGTLYQDYSTSITADFSKITRITLGKSSNRSSYQTDCCMNDFRIYDHCLSVAEVKEISRGLVLHYKLDEAYANDRELSLSIVSHDSTRTSTTENVTKAFDGKTTTKWYESLKHVTNIIVETTDSFPANKLALCSANDNHLYNARNLGQFDIYGSDDNITYKLLYSCTDQKYGTDAAYTWYYYDFINSRVYHYYKFSVIGRDAGVQIGEIKLLCNKTQVNDSSGYGNNGTIVGDIASDVNSSRYDNCCNFVNSCINSPMKPLEEITIAFWINRNQLTGTRQFIYAGWPGISIEFTGENGWLVYYTIDSSYATVGCSPTTQLQAGTWYHCALVIGKSGVAFYINGVCEKTNTYTAPYYGTTTIGQIGNYSSYKNFNAKLSDFRIYSTALSAEDIKQLYEVSAKIDNKNNLHCYEFIENNNNSINKRGIVDSNFEERNANVSIYKHVNLNLLQGTLIDTYRYERKSGMGTEFGKTFYPTEQLQTNTYYTFSAMIRGSANMNLYTINTGGNVYFTYVNKSDMNENEFRLFSVTFKVTGNRTINAIYPCSRYGNTDVGDWYEIQANSIKLEEGSMYTPWVPAETDDVYRTYDKMFVAKQLIEM